MVDEKYIYITSDVTKEFVAFRIDERRVKVAAMSIIFFVMAMCVLREFGVEARLKVYFEDLAIVSLDEKYFDKSKTEVFIAENEDTGENSITSTLAMIKKLPAITDARFMLFGLSMGEYSLPTGVDLHMKLCEMLDEPIIMGPFFAVLGFTRESCPPEPGVYAQEGYVLPLDALPDEFPENKYLVYIAIALKGKPLIAVNIYANIQSD